ncbi:MAG: hypothetical protein R2879_17205 [Saprospiraceae bacterium]
MKKLWHLAWALPLLLMVVFLMGPRPDFSPVNRSFSAFNIPLEDLDAYIKEKEDTVKLLKPGNEAKIVWADSVRQTEYSVVYLHGFSGGPGEGDPFHTLYAKKFGANLYIHRFPEHGIRDSNVFKNITPEDLVESAKEAIQIGKVLGKKVILLSCSTGSTLAFYLASGNPDIYALIAFSPNIDIADESSVWLTRPWGLQIARKILGSDYRIWYGPGDVPDYWTTKYRIEGLICLKDLVQQTMTEETFNGINQPIFTGYYFKDEHYQDGVISIPKIQWFWENISTPDSLSKKIAFPDAKHHVFISKHYPVDYQTPLDSVVNFSTDILKMKPVE